MSNGNLTYQNILTLLGMWRYAPYKVLLGIKREKNDKKLLSFSHRAKSLKSLKSLIAFLSIFYDIALREK